MDKRKHCTNYEALKNLKPLPVIKNPDGTLEKFSATFNGYSLTISDWAEMQKLNANGTFGKGSLSRNHPDNPEDVEILRERVFRARKKSFAAECKPRKVLVVPDSDDDCDYLHAINVRYEIDRSGFVETLNLSLEEGFFLLEIGCLEITAEGQVLSRIEAWELFRMTNGNFPRNYVVYFYYRSRNWVVKTGLKFGGDFVLYRGSPRLHHADYVVLIDAVDENNTRHDDSRRDQMEFKYLHGVNRLCETAGKQLLICQLIWPKDVQLASYDDISKITVREVLMKRWIPDGIKDDDDDYFTVIVFLKTNLSFKKIIFLV